MVRGRFAGRWWNSLSPPLRGVLAALGLLTVAAALATVALIATGVLAGRPGVEPEEIAAAARDIEADEDPFAFSGDRRLQLEQRAAIGNSHVIYEKSPGGVVASAARTNRFRDRIERAARAHDVDADLIEAMILLESAGRPEVIAGDDPEAASGLAQILASTGVDLLGMRIDLEQSRRLTKQLNRAIAELEDVSDELEDAGERKRKRLIRRVGALERKQLALRRRRAEIDERFDPRAALDAMATYLEIAKQRFGRDDLAVTSYHMGIGNLEDVIERYLGSDGAGAAVGERVSENDISYARLYFDSSPLRNQQSWELLASFGDDSSTYLWRVFAAREIMRLYRQDRDGLERLAELHAAKATAEEVFHPEEETEVFAGPAEIEVALEADDLVPIPPGRRYGYRVGDQLGEEARELGVDRSLYRALRPEALATLVYMAAKVQAISGKQRQRLIVTSAVRDGDYQAELVGDNPEATASYSLHTTGYSFDILRSYDSKAQAEGFQFMLDRLKALGVIAYAVEPAAIHVTVSNYARPLLE